jgi:hypothetical protein
VPDVVKGRSTVRAPEDKGVWEPRTVTCDHDDVRIRFTARQAVEPEVDIARTTHLTVVRDRSDVRPCSAADVVFEYIALFIVVGPSFEVQGFNRKYWDLFVAAGFSVGVFYLFAAILAWQLGGLPAPTLALRRGTRWAFALCFAAITVVSWRYLFILPIVFSIVITLCLTAAAWLSAKQASLPALR